MCELFIGADSAKWISRTKSLRIDGVATSIRIEEFFWSILDEIAHRDAMTVNQLITRLYFESLDAGHDIGNFTSFLRVCCGRYLSLIADEELARGSDTALGDLAAREILDREVTRDTARAQRHSQSEPGQLRTSRLSS
jgi:predicted DNA-binding ribbon-helix-helix protein